MNFSGRAFSGQTEAAVQRQADAGGAAWYLYGITRALTPDALRQAVATAQDAVMPGAGSAPVQAFVRGKIAAIVRTVSLADFEPDALRERLDDLTWLEAMARAHNAVIAAIHERQVILPAKFGSVYVSRDDLGAALDADQQRLLGELRRLHDCDEWAIHLYADRATIEHQVADEDSDLRRLRDEIAEARPGRAYFLQRKLDGEVSAAVDDALAERARGVVDRLRPFTRDVVLQATVRARGGSDGDEAEILRAALLIERTNREGAFHAFQSGIDTQVGLRGECSGPWPPYSFVTQPEASQHEP